MSKLILVPLIFAGFVAWRRSGATVEQVLEHLARLWQTAWLRRVLLTTAFVVAALGWLYRPVTVIVMEARPKEPEKKRARMGGQFPPRKALAKPQPPPPPKDSAAVPKKDPPKKPAEKTPPPPVVAPTPPDLPPRAKHPGWIAHYPQPEADPELPTVAEGLLWEVVAIPSTGDKPNIGHVRVDEDGLRCYTYAHDENSPPHDAGVFLSQWNVANGGLAWGQRLNCDLPPAFAPAGGAHLAVYDEQPLQRLASKPVPGNSPIYPIWILNRIEGGLLGPVPTFPLAAFHIGGRISGRNPFFRAMSTFHLAGICPRDKDLKGPEHTGNSFADDYFTNKTYDLSWRYIRGASRIVSQVTRHLEPEPIDTAIYQPQAIFTATRVDPRVCVRETISGGVRGVYEGHRTPVGFIRNKGDHVLTADNREIHHWRHQSPQETICRTRLPDIPRSCMEVTPSWDYVLIGTKEGTLILHDLTHQERVGEPIQAHDGAVLEIAVSPDWRRAFSIGADGRLKCWGLPVRPVDHQTDSAVTGSAPRVATFAPRPTKSDAPGTVARSTPEPSPSGKEDGPTFRHGFAIFRATRGGRGVDIRTGVSFPLEEIAPPHVMEWYRSVTK